MLTRITTNFIYPNVVLPECDVASFKFLCRNALQIEEAPGGGGVHLCKGKRYFLQIYKKDFYGMYSKYGLCDSSCPIKPSLYFILVTYPCRETDLTNH